MCMAHVYFTQDHSMQILWLKVKVKKSVLSFFSLVMDLGSNIYLVTSGVLSEDLVIGQGNF